MLFIYVTSSRTGSYETNRNVETIYRPYSYCCGWTGISVVEARAHGKALLLKMLPSPARFYARWTETARIQVGPSCLNSSGCRVFVSFSQSC